MEDRLAQVIHQGAVGHAFPCLVGAVIQRGAGALVEVVELLGCPVLGHQLGAFEVANPYAAGQAVGVESEQGVLQVRFQHHAAVEQAMQHAAEQLSGITVEPAQGGFGVVDAKPRGIALHLGLADAVAVQAPGKQRHRHLRSVALAAGRVEVLPV